jgi:hypothetical protein
MIDIIAQMNPGALAALIILLALGFLGAVILKLVKSGKAKSPKDLVQVARDRAATSKATKEAHKLAEAAFAEPVASSRLSRIAARPDEEELVAEDEIAGEIADSDEFADPVTAAAADADTWPATHDDADEASEVHSAQLEDYRLEETPDLAEQLVELVSDDMSAPPSAIAEPAEEWVAPPPPATTPLPPRPVALDLADPANHPQNWDALVAVVDTLEVALQGPWPEDRLLPVPRFEDSAADPEAAARAASQRQSAIQLARTINGAAREQAQEIIAVVREFAHSAPFSPQDCAAVMTGLGAIEWMALIERGATVEKRTLPLTQHDPETPLWVHDAVAAIYREAHRNAA